MADTIKQFTQLYASLVQEKKDLESRLEEISKALKGDLKVPRKIKKKKAAPKNGRKKKAKKKKAAPKNGRKKKGGKKKAAQKKTAKRAKNKSSLRVSITNILGKKHMDKKEILKAVLASGYQFTAKDPMNSLLVQLYTKFKKDKDRKFYV